MGTLKPEWTRSRYLAQRDCVAAALTRYQASGYWPSPIAFTVGPEKVLAATPGQQAGRAIRVTSVDSATSSEADRDAWDAFTVGWQCADRCGLYHQLAHFDRFAAETVRRRAQAVLSTGSVSVSLPPDVDDRDRVVAAVTAQLVGDAELLATLRSTFRSLLNEAHKLTNEPTLTPVGGRWRPPAADPL
eukprot:contig_13373_g3199